MKSLTSSQLRRLVAGLGARLLSAIPQLHIGVRLALGFGLVLALYAGSTIFSIMQMRSIEGSMSSAVQAHAEIATRANMMRKSIDDAYLNALQLLLATQSDDIKYYKGLVDQSRANYLQAKSELLAITHDGNDITGMPEAMEKITASERVLTEINHTIFRRLDASRADTAADEIGPDPALIDNLTGTIRGRVDLWIKDVTPIVEATVNAGRERQARAEKAAVLARAVQIVSSLAALLLGGFAAWVIARGVAVPIRDAVLVAERIAQGDLSIAVARGRRDETGALLDALARMQTSLGGLVHEVRDAARSIRTVSYEVASGNSELSQRTEHAASQLKRTASSVEHLSTAVRQSAESARTADELASDAAGAAEQGVRVVAEVVDSMQDIASQSRKISDIIGVIDSIAFQTNILALNAAVEAARAGEQGRGFSVVAEEVRNLARHSASAAKDIKQLIQSSVASVESGSSMVQDAGNKMDGILTQVRNLRSAIKEITHAASSQRDGIEVVVQAMNEIDRSTQQNSTLVVQSAASAESLKTQAERLAHTMEAFRLAER